MLNPEEALFHYQAKVTKVVDGDTMHLDIDLGFFTWQRNVIVRLYGVNTPEIRGAERPEGLRVKDIVTSELLNKTITIRSFKGNDSDKYGRWLVYIFLDGANYNQSLIDRGLAVAYMTD